MHLYFLWMILKWIWDDCRLIRRDKTTGGMSMKEVKQLNNELSNGEYAYTIRKTSYKYRDYEPIIMNTVFCSHMEHTFVVFTHWGKVFRMKYIRDYFLKERRWIIAKKIEDFAISRGWKGYKEDGSPENFLGDNCIKKYSSTFHEDYHEDLHFIDENITRILGKKIFQTSDDRYIDSSMDCDFFIGGKTKDGRINMKDIFGDTFISEKIEFQIVHTSYQPDVELLGFQGDETVWRKSDLDEKQSYIREYKVAIEKDLFLLNFLPSIKHSHSFDSYVEADIVYFAYKGIDIVSLFEQDKNTCQMRSSGSSSSSARSYGLSFFGRLLGRFA